MLVVRLIRKFFSLLRSDLSGHEIGLGFCFGILLGCIPLSSVWAVTGVVGLVLILRSSLSAFLLAAVVVKALSFAVDPILFELGAFALEGPLSGIFSWLVNQPVVALLDLHRYVVAGGVLFTLCCSLVCYPALYFLTRRYRSMILKWTETSPAFSRFTRFPLVRFVTWLFMGKKKGEYAETLEARRSPVRKGAVVLLVFLAAVVWAFAFFLGDTVAKAGFEAGVSRATDSDVSVRELSLSLLRGALDLKDFRSYEREADKVISSAVLLSGDLSVVDLLKKHLVFDEILIENMDFRVAREERGGSEERKGKEAPEQPGDGGPMVDGEMLETIWQHRELARDVLDRLLQVLFPPDRETREEERIEDIREACAKGARYADQYADFLLERNLPQLVIKNLYVKGLKLKVKDEGESGSDHAFERLTLQASSLSSNPFLYGKDSELLLGDRELQDPTVSIRCLLNWSNPDPVHSLEVKLREVPSEAVLRFLRPGKDLRLEQGTVSLVSETRLEAGSLLSVNRFVLKGMTVKPAKPGAKILGLDGDLFCRGLTEFLKEAPLETEVRIFGPYRKLAVEVDEQGLLDSVKEGVLRTGDRVLAEQLDEQMQRAQALADEHMEKAKEEIKEEVEALEEKVKDGLGDRIEDLFGGKKDQKGEKKKTRGPTNKK